MALNEISATLIMKCQGNVNHLYIRLDKSEYQVNNFISP